MSECSVLITGAKIGGTQKSNGEEESDMSESLLFFWRERKGGERYWLILTVMSVIFTMWVLDWKHIQRNFLFPCLIVVSTSNTLRQAKILYQSTAWIGVCSPSPACSWHFYPLLTNLHCFFRCFSTAGTFIQEPLESHRHFSVFWFVIGQKMMIYSLA